METKVEKSRVVWSDTKDHGVIDSKGRRTGHVATVGEGYLGVWWQIRATRDGVRFGASRGVNKAPTVAMAIAAAKAKLARTKAPPV